MVCLNSQDKGNMPLRHDRDVNDIEAEQRADLHLWSCTGTYRQGRRNPCRNATVKSPWSEDHGDQSLRYDRDDDDLGERNEFLNEQETVGKRLSHPQPARENL